MAPPRLFSLTALVAWAIVACLWLSPSSAFATHPCHSIKVGPESRVARVATVRVACEIGREVASDVYREIEEQGSQAGTPTFHTRGFSCQAVLAETELSCQRRRQWVFASTQVTDHPSEWNPPPPPPRKCGGIPRAEGFLILAATPRTTCHFARAAAKKVRHVALHNEGRGIPDRFKIKVAGRPLSCRNTYRGRIERIICQGRQRKMVMEYTSPKRG